MIKLYEEFLGKPNGHKSHELLHTYYTAREKYPITAEVEDVMLISKMLLKATVADNHS
ncbi:iron hydrogenase small subunit [Alkaliphilus metalliredigens]|uniref:iron hydrogenase small subunit n=1 Tax=Alkaliphilus metalliredigens TaxID=208226 RepID=UPI0038CBFDD2